MQGRMPYAKVTKAFYLVGWKRLELNDLLDFGTIKESSFEAIRRRFAVIKIAARFLEPEVLAALAIGSDPAELGLFRRAHDLEAFLTSGPAAATGLKLKYAFERINDLEECRRKIAHYTRGGGDRGTSVEYLRRASNLPAVPAEDSHAGLFKELIVEDSSYSADPAPALPNHDASAWMRSELLKRGFNHLTRGYLNQIKLPRHITCTKDALWTHFKTSGQWHDLGQVCPGPKGRVLPVTN